VNGLAHLAADAPSYHFFQAVRLVQASVPRAVPVGYQGPVEQEAVRFRADLSLAFPTSDLVEATVQGQRDDRTRWQFTISFLGLYGPSSPLPAYFTENLLRRESEGLTRGFLDLFHHRLTSLAYRSWTKYHPEVSVEETKRLSGMLAHTLDATAAASASLPVERILAHAGALSRLAPPAPMVARVLSLHFDVPVTVEECLARWTRIPEDARSLLGLSGRLGRDSVVGRSIFNRTTAFGLSIGPVTRSAFDELIPGGARHRELIALLRRLNPEQFECQVEIDIAVADLPATTLGRPTGALGYGARLGGRRDRSYKVRFMLPNDGSGTN
jgi:type VI secretion system protein ImpH